MIRKITDGVTPKQYLQQIICGFVALFGLYLIVAWSSYSSFDNAWSVSSYQTESINKAGAFGAWLIDLFFVLFGDVGNLFPFIFSAVPIYMLWTKSIVKLTWTRFTLRLLGFIVLCCGLTVLCALLLNNDGYSLAGGVLGASLVKQFLPFLGKFGLLLSGLILSIVGFIFCSGASLIHLLVAFYHWLTANEDVPKQVVSYAEPHIETESEAVEGRVSVENHGEASLEMEIETAEQSPIFSPYNENIDVAPINIIGLAAETTQFNPAQLGNYGVEAEELPEIRIQNDEAFAAVELSQPLQINTPWQAVETPAVNLPTAPAFLDPRQSTVVMPEPEQFEVAIPEVKLAPPTRVQPIDENELEKTSEKSSALFDDLAFEFAEKERQREALRQQQMAELGGIEDIPEPNLNEQSGLRTLSVDQVVELFGDHKSTVVNPNTALPSIDLLDKRDIKAQEITPEEIRHTSQRIEQQLNNFNVKASVKDVLVGPVVTRYELELQPGVKAAKVTNIETDLARALMFRSIRVAETIPDKPYIGIETPNAHRQIVPLRDVLESEEFRHSDAILPMALGKDISGKAVVIDLAKTPHLLVAGSTGSGKSVGINTMILSLLFRVKPEKVKFIMIDPKVVELSVYNDIPHLLTEVVTDMKKAANALRWCVDEMERRYQLLSKLRVRNIEGFNERIDAYRAENIVIPDPLWKPGDSMDTSAPILQKLSYIVVIVDEFADLMMVAGKQIEELIARLTQKARAVGIHVILATQRPSVDVITGLIKSNIPSRIAFTVVQRNDSRTILDQNGAETLLGRGDMLYLGNGTTDLVRVHGAFMSDEEVNRVADDWRARGKPEYISAILESSDEESDDNEGYAGEGSDELDPLFDEVMEFVIRTGTTSASSIQRRFRVGFNRAARIMDQLEEQGIVSEMRNGKREILARNTDY